jgi:glucose-6-phosphate 1-epimerase
MKHRALGAQVLQVEAGNGLPLLYLSPLQSPSKPVRGGVPVLFPQFAEAGPLTKHGFVRNVGWRLLRDQVSLAGHHQVQYALDVAPGDVAEWPHGASLRLHAVRKRNALLLTLRVRNTGTTAFSWTGGLHPYWMVCIRCQSICRTASLWSC